MNSRFKLSVALTLVIVLGGSQLLALASGHQKLVAPAPVAATSATPVNQRKPLTLPKRLVLSRLLVRRPLQSASVAGSVPGQSVTLLPDGRSLKIGGLESNDMASI